MAHFDGRWQPPELSPGPMEVLVERNRKRGAAPEGDTAGARWKREVDIPDEGCLRAYEAMG